MPSTTMSMLLAPPVLRSAWLELKGQSVVLRINEQHEETLAA